MATAREDSPGEVFDCELAALIVLTISGTPKRAYACSMNSQAWQAFSVMATFWASTRRLATSTTAVRYTNPLAMRM